MLLVDEIYFRNAAYFITNLQYIQSPPYCPLCETETHNSGPPPTDSGREWVDNINNNKPVHLNIQYFFAQSVVDYWNAFLR